MRLGIFGGTFDPIHLGHLAIAEEARVALDLASVVFVPAGVPPHKLGVAITTAADRLEMVRRAIADNPGFAVDESELRRSGISYTVDTLEIFSSRHPQAELFYLLGSDSVVELETWHDPARLFALATFVALVRPGWPAERIDAWMAAQPSSARPRLLTLRVPGLDVASRELRLRVATGLPIRYLVPGSVCEWIAQRRLYSSEGSQGGAPNAAGL